MPKPDFDPKTFPTDRYTFVTFHDDGSVSAYLGTSWLCNEDSRKEAEAEANRVIRSFRNGDSWTVKEFHYLAKQLEMLPK
jgi:hypothetical protein